MADYSVDELEQMTKAAGAKWRRQYGPRDQVDIDRTSFGSYKKGGIVKKTGLAKLHKGERVLTTKQTKSFKKAK